VIFQLPRGALDFNTDAASPFEEHHSSFRQDGLSADPVEELVSELAFKFYYLLAKRWLSNVRSSGRPGEIAGISDRDDVTKLA